MSHGPPIETHRYGCAPGAVGKDFISYPIRLSFLSLCIVGVSNVYRILECIESVSSVSEATQVYQCVSDMYRRYICIGGVSYIRYKCIHGIGRYSPIQSDTLLMHRLHCIGLWCEQRCELCKDPLFLTKPALPRCASMHVVPSGRHGVHPTAQHIALDQGWCKFGEKHFAEGGCISVAAPGYI